jgi:outer membrane protein assembly factor BamB
MMIAVAIIGGAVVVGGIVGGLVAFKNRKAAPSVQNGPSTAPTVATAGPGKPAVAAPNDMAMDPMDSTLTTPAVQSVAAGSGSDSPNPWPQFRGPNRDAKSTETGLLKQWPAAGPPLLWKATGLGSGYSSVSVAGGKVFTMGDGRGGSSQVHAFDEQSGAAVWMSRAVGRTGGKYDGTKSTPAIDVAAGRLYALGQFGDLVCLNIGNGQEVWRKSLTSDFGGKFGNWNYAESPLLDGDKVLVSPGGRRGAVVALNKTTGATIWQSRQYTDEAQYVSLIVSPMGPRRHYLTMSQKTVAGIDAQSGNLMWRIPRAGKTAVIPSPVVYNNIVFVTSGYNVGCNAFQIGTQGGRITTRQLYSNKDLVNHHGGVVVVDKYVYGHSDRGGWKCLDITTGEVLWENRGVGKGSVIYVDGHLICRGEAGSGNIALVVATPQGYQEKGRFAQPDRSNKNSWAHPVVANGKLFLRDQGVLLCFNLRGG